MDKGGENFMQHETVIVLDFGGQYNQLIARRVRENNVYCEIYSYKTDLSVIKAKNPKGIIFTGGPNSVYLEDSPTIDPEIFNWGVPVLGICYGSQLMMHLLGGHVCRAPEREYGKTEVFVDTNSKMFTDVQPSTICWMSHNDYIEQAAPGFKITAHTVNCPVAAAENEEKGLYAVQFHPEVLHTAEGKKMLRNFVYNVCGCTGDWKMDSFVENNVKALRERIGDGKVLCALSGGVDSSVLAAMLAKAIGKQLTCVFVDHGLLRKNEKEEVCAVFGPGNANGFDINFICVDARDRYFAKLAGVTEPERKRKIIGEEFIRVFEEQAKKIGKVDFLAHRSLLQSLYGEQHPCGKIVVEEDYHAITPEVLRNFYERYYHSGNCSIFLSGKVTEDIIRRVKDAFGSPFGQYQLQTSKLNFPYIAVPEKRIFTEREDAMQSAVKMGYTTITREHPDYLKLRVLMTVFGGYFGSRLMSNIREEKGYTYGISAGIMFYPDSGLLIVSTETDNEYVEPLIQEVYHEIDRLHQEVVPVEELSMVRNYMLGEMCRSYESAFSLSDAWIFIATSGLGDDYFSRSLQAVQEVTPAELQDLAQRYLCKEKLKEVIAGKKIS